jgi:TonB-dependent SusC/RagA subfamily outer membrane receptor
MKNLLLTISLIACIQLVSQAQTEKDITSSIKKVTIFSHGAQVENEATVSVQPGQLVFRFTGLSPYINKESIRIDGDGSFTILNVQHQNDYMNKLDKSKETESLQSKIEELKLKIEDETTRINILKQKLGFLEVNIQVTGKEQPVNPETFKVMNTYYGDNVEALNLEMLKKQRLINDYNKQVTQLTNQLNSLNTNVDLPSGTIIVTINSKQTHSSKLVFNYLVDYASWYPSYDIRFQGINKPLSITYKANIRQNTGTDWKDVDIILSTAKTNISAQIPEISASYLQFYYPEISQRLQGKVAGVQISNDELIPGSAPEVSVRGAGSLISGNNPLYVVDGVPQSNVSSIDPNDIDKIEVLKDASATAIYGSRGANGVILVTTKQNKEKSSIPITITSKQETSNEYLVDAKQTILSNNKNTTVVFKESDLTAGFEYQSIPKLSENVFLIAKINDWYKAELMDGEASIYLENSYVGKSMINTRQFKDTLELSFGIDNNISVKRERLTEFTENQFIGSNRKDTRAYKLTIRNNKSYPVTAKISDQIPVSNTKEIQIEALELSGGKPESDTGKVVWEITLKPNESKDLTIKYSVKYPKDKQVVVD